MNYTALILLGFFTFPAHAAEIDSRGLEALLVKSLNSVGSNKLDVALEEVDTLLKVNPNFKLAQMLKGDLLMARAKPLSGFGNDPDAPSDRVNDLRDEARARLQRVQQQPVTTAPRFIWQLNPQQRYAIVVDTSKSTLYLYKNDNGTPRYVENFYISVGKKGSDKSAEGDQKTPLGGLPGGRRRRAYQDPGPLRTRSVPQRWEPAEGACRPMAAHLAPHSHPR